MENRPIVTLGEIRKFVSLADRISVCQKETLDYENFENIRDVPHSYDEQYLFGVGIIESEVRVEKGALMGSHLEIMVSRAPRFFDERDWNKSQDEWRRSQKRKNHEKEI